MSNKSLEPYIKISPIFKKDYDVIKVFECKVCKRVFKTFEGYLNHYEDVEQ